MKEQQLARNLAFFSLGLGAAELFAPRQVARLIGIDEEHAKTLQMLGLREIASGLGIMQGKPAYFLWSRVAGDIMDLALLGAAMKSERSDQRRLEGTIFAVAAVTVADIVTSVLHSRDHVEPAWRDRRPMSSRAGIAGGEPFSPAAHEGAAMPRSQPTLVT
jgi:hypothetical protein